MPTLSFLLKNSTTTLTYDFPDDCVIRVGRSSAAPGMNISASDGHYEVRADLVSLSEDHCTLTVVRGAVSLEDQGSRNGTFVRLAPHSPYPLDHQPVLLCKDLTLRLERSTDAVIPDFREPSPERLLSALRSGLDRHALRVELGPPQDLSFPLCGDARYLNVHASHPDRTVAMDDLTWVQRVVNAYNAAFDARRQELPWRFLAASRARVQVLDQARRAAPASLPVLLIGPTGSGKEILAHDLHQHSTQRQGPFVSVNCGTLDADRLEAQLFGFVRGAYTGAHADTQGLVEAAADGTLFLDEIGEMAPAVQVRLLRFLESTSGEYRRMGEVKTRHARVRILAATHRALHGRDARGFREDLYYRLSGVRIDIPPLAPEDIQAIAAHLLREATAHLSQPPSPREIALIAHAASTRRWPGGARELRQCIHRCAQLRDPELSWARSWEIALGQPTTDAPPVTVTGALNAQPAAVGRLLADLLFLHTAYEATHVAALARGLHMSYQAADARLTAFGTSLDDKPGLSAHIRQRTEELRALTDQSPSLASVLQSLLGA